MLLLIFNYVSIADLGTGYAVTYRLTRAVARGNLRYAEKILRHALPFYVAVGLVSTGLFYYWATEISQFVTRSPDHAPVCRLIALSILPLLLDAVVLTILQAFNKVYLINASRLLYDLCRAAPLLLAMVVKDGLLQKVILMIVAGTYIKLGADLYLAYRMLGNFRWLRPSILRKELAVNLRYGMPMMLAVGMGMVITSMDRFYITNFLSVEYLAYYSVALEVNVKAWFLVWAVTGTLQTVLLRRNVSGASTADLQNLSLYAVGVIFVLYYLPLMIFAREILTLWINADFAAKCCRMTRILSVASLFYMIYSVKHSVLQAQGRFLTISGIYGAGLALLVMLLLAMPRRYGSDGVACTYVLTYALFVISAMTCMRRVKPAHA